METWAGAIRIIFFCVCCVLAVSKGSLLTYQVSPDTLLPPVTESLNMGCSLNDSGLTSNGALVGREVSQGTSNEALVGREVSQKLEDIHHVTSVIIIRDNDKDVASVSSFSPAAALLDLDLLTVTGGIGGTGGELAHIELYWKYPTDLQAGSYRCEITAITNQGHSVVFSKTLEIGATAPSMADLAHYIHDLQIKTDHMAAMDNKMKGMELTISNMNAKTKDMEKELEERKHIEHGAFNCGERHTSTGTNINITRQFTTPYDQPPIVHYSVIHLDDSPITNTRFGVWLMHVDERGFTMDCMTWADSHIYGITVDWISFAK